MTKPLYFWNGTTFELVGPTTPQSPFAYQTSAPTAPATGDIWIDSDGDVDTYNRQLTRYYFVASAGQTSVSGTDANGLTLAYVAGSEQVYVNGALQVRGVDYTATNGTSITNLSALALNDVVEVFAYTAFTVANAYTKTETDSVAAAAAGLRMVVPTSVAVGSGTGSANAAGYVTFSGASSVSLNGIFTSIYDNYKIIISCSSFSADTDFWIKLRASGTDSSTNYNWANTLLDTGNASVNAVGTSGTNGIFLSRTDAGTSNAYGYELTLSGVFAATPTTFLGLSVGRSGAGVLQGGTINGNHTTSTSYDGITLLTSSGTVTGTIGVYGYKD